MKKRLLFIVITIVTLIVGIGLYKKISSSTADDREICITASNIPGAKEEVHLISQALILQDIKKKQIKINQKGDSTNAPIRIFLDQESFSEAIKNNDETLKIGIHLHDPIDEEDPKIVGLLQENNVEQLLELVEGIIKEPTSCLMIYDEKDTQANKLLAQYQEIAKIKKINLHTISLSTKNNIATTLKSLSAKINAVILLPSSLIFSDLELILEHFKLKKIPIFSNHLGLIRAGVLGGYDFDVQEIAHDIAEISTGFLYGQVKKDTFEEIHSQLHLNMDTIKHLGIQLESEDILDEAITVGGADL